MRLTNDMRRTIREKLVARAFDDRYTELTRQSNKLFNLAVDDFLGDLKDVFNGLPEDWVERADTLYIETRRSGEVLVGAHYRNVPKPIDYSIQLDQLSAPVAKQIKTYFKAKAALDAEKEHFEAEVSGVLYAATTTKKLYQIWPELAEIYTVSESAPCANTALVPTVAHLNKTLGLPSE